MEFEVKTITPAMAEAYIATNPQNRNVSQNHVLYLGMQMEAGKWQLNGQPIIISDKGKLLDGQHRMFAIILSKTAVEMTVVSGISEKAFETLDTGRQRNAGDTLSILNIPAPKTAAAAAAGLWKIISGLDFYVACPPQYVARIWPRYPSLAKWVGYVNSINKGLTLPQTALFLAIVYLEDIAGKPELAEQFFAGITKGAGLKDGSPILALRNRVMTERTLGKVLDLRAVWPAVVQTINALEEGKELQRVMMKANMGPAERPKLFDEHFKSLSPEMQLCDLVGFRRNDGSNSRKKFNEYVKEVRGS